MNAATTTPPRDIGDISLRLAEIKAEIRDVVERRQNILATACAEILATGTDARVVKSQRRTNTWQVGDRVVVTDAYNVYPTSVDRRSYMNPAEGLRRLSWGPETYVLGLLVHHGVYEVLLIDDDDVLVVQVEQESEQDHRRAVSRLRNLARKDGLRVQARDREITLTDPMGNAVHQGEVTSAFCWLLNIDIQEV